MSNRNKVVGDSNILIGRDLVVTVEDLKESDKHLSRLVESKLRDADSFVARYLPNGIVSQNNESPKPFSSETILESLGSLGVPLIAGLEVLNESVRNIVSIPKTSEPISTRKVRAFVTEALYGLNEQRYSRTRIEKWGDAYVRRYGSDSAIRIINSDGTEDELKYDFLLNSILPSLLESITSDIQFIAAKEELVSRLSRDRMTEEILETVSSLNVYRIHYETLFMLCKEICLQPPHPWFSTRVRDFEYVNYDYEKYKINFRKAVRYRNEGRLQKCAYALKETIHHSCSAFLSYYSIYMGCGTLAPLYVLKNILSKINKKDDEKLHAMFKLGEIESDLEKREYKLVHLYSILETISKHLMSQRELTTLNIESLFVTTKELYSIVTATLASFLRVEKLKRLDLSNIRRLDLTINDIFMCFPHLEWYWHDTQEAFWLIHQYEGRVFSELKSNILFVPISKECDHVEAVKNWAEQLKLHSKLSNTLLFLSHDKALTLRGVIPDDMYQNYFFASFSFDQLVEIVSSENPVKKIEDAIVKQQ